jgi:chromate reductase, NAD(P)H dehydrogenase (quinone)
MMESKKIAILVGSLRKESFSRKTARALIALAPESLLLEIVEIGGLAMYNQDLEEAPPAAWTEFRTRIKGFDGVLFVTPEYNRSVPAVMKNAIDVGSRPYGKNIWTGKPGAVVSVTPGKLGAFGANHHIRQSLMAINILIMSQPEIYLSGAATLFDDQGNLSDESTREHLKKFLNAFAELVAKNTPR